MRWVIIILLSLISTISYSQSISDIKHVEVVSEIQDSMVLLNKMDVDKINKTFYEKRQIDSLRQIECELIKVLEIKNSELDSIIRNQRAIIQNQSDIQINLTKNIEDKTDYYEKCLSKERTKKRLWQTSTVTCIIGIIIVAIL